MTSQQNNREGPALTHDNARWVGVAVTACGIALCILAARAASAPEAPRLPSSLARNTPHNRVSIAGGSLKLAPNDWEALGKVAPLTLDVRPFTIDRYEVTIGEWAACADCTPHTTTAAPNTPQTRMTATEAQHYCETNGGRLPTIEEWTFAASSAQGYRYPWGQTGLVCRKAVYGMVNGPCGSGATTPSPIGDRDLGTTPSGIHDLCGNVAEWATEGARTFAAGGSFRSTLAGQLKVWAREETTNPRDDIGFRCVYAQ